MAALHWCWTFKILKGLGGLFWILECVRRVTSVKIYSLHQILMLIFPESRTKAQTEREAMAMYDMTAWEIEFFMFGFDGLCQFNRWIDCCLYLWNEFLLKPRCGACAEFICGNWFRNSCNIFLLAKFILKLKLYRGIFQYLHHPFVTRNILSQACKVVNYRASGWPSGPCSVNAKQALINFNTEDEFLGVLPLSFVLLYVYSLL